MKNIPYILLICISSCSQSNDKASFSFPPEWESHKAVWVDFAREDAPVNDQEARLDIIHKLHQYVPVKVVVDSDSIQSVATEWLLSNKVDTSKISFYQHPIPNSWIRDAGPLFLSNGSELKLADFKWNCYGNPKWCEDQLFARRGEVDNDLANGMGLDVSTVDLFAEGGGLEVSSSAIIAYEEMALQRNPDKSITEVERIILDLYGKEKMIWLKDAPILEMNGNKTENYFGQGANGHIDAFVRFVNDSTIFVTTMNENEKSNSPVQSIDYERLQSNLEQIKKERDSKGKPFNIVEIPMPDISLYEFRTVVNQWNVDYLENVEIGDSIVYVPNMGYANFLISNGVILVSQYWKEGFPESEREKDKYMLDLLREHFPDRDILGIDALSINWNGGGIHCRTQQEPKVN